MTHRHPGVSIIVAVDNNNAIGRAGDLLYHISADLRNFRRLTTGNIVVMGRRTFESLPKGALPDRVNMVIKLTKLKMSSCAIRSKAHWLLRAQSFPSGKLLSSAAAKSIARHFPSPTNYISPLSLSYWHYCAICR